jgi:hypothetical protein
MLRNGLREAPEASDAEGSKRSMPAFQDVLSRSLVSVMQTI